MSTYLAALVGAIAIIAAYSGNAEPYVAASEMPGEPWYAFVAIAVLLVAAALTSRVLTTRAWTTMGRRANFSPAGGGSPLGKSDLVANIRGRTVRARTVSRKRSDGDQGSTRVTFTVVEADLEDPTDAGLLLGRTGDDGTVTGTDVGGGTLQTRRVGDDFVVVGESSTAFAEQLLTPRARDALADVDDLGTLTVGDPSGVVADAIPEQSDSFVGGVVENKMAELIERAIHGDRNRVANETRGVLLDSHELARQAEAVAALADALEDATDDDGGITADATV
jgi:hypothetical protein